VPDPRGILDLPKGFEYQVIATAGEEMDDGLLVPPRADGMAAFESPPGQDEGLITLICNHENHPSRPGAFGPRHERLALISAEDFYDAGNGVTPGTGGTTTIVYDPRAREVRHRHLSLAGTEINCAGGKTPWGSWLSCEECFKDPGAETGRLGTVHRQRRHGYIFEVPADETGRVRPEPLTFMGRFEHEAAAVEPRSGVIYLSEDKHRSLLYRFLPAVPGKLAEGGKLQALAIAGHPSYDTRNWGTAAPMPSRQWFDTRWIDLEEPDPDENELRLAGFERGAARFARGEGLTYADGSLFMTATIGGPDRLGQVFEYRPSAVEGQDGETRAPGRLRLFAECQPDSLLRNADNLAVGPWGDLVICEDTASHCGLVGMTADGLQYPIADNPYSTSELAGICFSPDGQVMFVNIQVRGLTLAITGPWKGRSAAG
jgi:secreted PhoX family phosphatase